MTESAGGHEKFIKWNDQYWGIVSPTEIEPLQWTIEGLKNPEDYRAWRTARYERELASNAVLLRRKGAAAGSIILKQATQSKPVLAQIAADAENLAARYQDLLDYVDRLDAVAGGNPSPETE